MATAQTETPEAPATDPALLAGEPPAADEIQTDAPAAPEADPAVETYARSQGWVPKEQYHGDASKWVDAKTFADRAEQINPIIKARLRDEQQKTEALKKDVERLREEGKTFAEFVRGQERARYDAELATLRAARAAAVAEGDGEKFEELDGKIAKLKPPPADTKKDDAPPVAEPPAELRAAAEAFAARYDWLDPAKSTYDAPKARLLRATAGALREDNPELINTPGFFTELERRMKADYPQVFAAAKPKAMVDGGGAPGGASTPGKKTFKDMPKDAQDTAKRWVANGWLKDTDAYVKNYYEAMGEQQ